MCPDHILLGQEPDLADEICSHNLHHSLYTEMLNILSFYKYVFCDNVLALDLYYCLYNK